jgi:hypothetical protein
MAFFTNLFSYNKNCDIQNNYDNITFRINEKLSDAQKDSASTSIICKGIYNDKKVFFKIFYIDENYNDNLEYEAKIYNFITAQSNEKTKKYIENYFIKMYFYKKFNIKEFKELFDTTNINIYNEIIEFFKTNKNNIDGENKKIAIICTEDTESQTLKTFLLNYIYEINNEEEIKNKLKIIFLIIINAIYILNEILKINHNDIHFSNILIKETPKPNPTIYYIKNNRKFDSIYQIKIYDFDRSYRDRCQNKYIERYELEKIGQAYNKLTFHDNFIFIRSIFIHLDYLESNNLTNAKNALNSIIEILIPDESKREIFKNENIIKNYISDKEDLIEKKTLENEKKKSLCVTLKKLKKDNTISESECNTFYNKSNNYKNVFWSSFCYIDEESKKNDCNIDNVVKYYGKKTLNLIDKAENLINYTIGCIPITNSENKYFKKYNKYKTKYYYLSVENKLI